MADDDGVCEQSPDGDHTFELTNVVINGIGSGLSTVDTCSWCGAQAYEASESDRR